MATKLFTEKIDKTYDWGGDEKTQGLSVSGARVQEFIKDSLNSKFGKIYYDKDSTLMENGKIVVAEHTPTKQYLIFADDYDFKLWGQSPADNAGLILGNFDAPAPASIEITDRGNQTLTILDVDKDKSFISFKYRVKKSDGDYEKSTMSYTISINNNIYGITNLPARQLDMQTGNNDAFGEFYFGGNDNELGQYLKTGINTITITLTSLAFNVSVNVIYQYKILDLQLTSDFEYYKGISLTNDAIRLNINATGMGTKILNVFIDGEQLNDLNDLTEPQKFNKSDAFIGVANNVQYELLLPFKNSNNEYKSWATVGLHNIQFYFYITDENGQAIKSKTLYYDFVLTNIGATHESYVLFAREFDNGTIFENGSKMSITSEQYTPINVEYAVYDNANSGNTDNGKKILVDIKLEYKDKTISSEPIWTTEQSVASGSVSEINYISSIYGSTVLTITNTMNTTNTNTKVKVVDVEINKSSVEISKETDKLLLELSALNRSNSETEEKRTDWSYEYNDGIRTTVYKAQFNNVLWNLQNGWKDNCLVLNNGATVTIPINLFAQYQNGLTFEIDFETENVQDDEAEIMKYGVENGEHIFIKACSAELQSHNKINIHTNYKDGSRQKIQFIFGYNGNDTESANNLEMPYLMYIVVNGILDRVAQFTSIDSISSTADEYQNIVIGNLDNKVTTKIHSIRIYRKALTLDQCVDNNIADSTDVRRKYLKNDIYDTDGKTIDINKLLGSDISVPVMTIYGDIENSIVQVFNKKSNVPVDVLYQDPNNPEFNFFAHDAWLSNQGTSSMNYPRRNLRLYFNKKADANTLYGFGTTPRYDYKTRVWWGLTDSQIIKDIQTGAIEDLDSPIRDTADANKYYYPLYNKKSFKKKGAEITVDVAKMFVHSGISIYSDAEGSTKIKNLNKYVNENPGAPIYALGAYTRFKTKDLYTDRWTLKCDYAESSMTHNGGVGRLWGDVMRDVVVGSNGFRYTIEGEKIQDETPGITNAQAAAKQYNNEHKGEKITINGVQQDLVFGDIRTSCDCRPIVIVNKPRIKNGNTYEEDFGEAIFLGLYNIMTDKGSTPLFGFEDLKDEDGRLLFDASHTECWECLQNGSNLAQMNDFVSDDTDGSTVPYVEGGNNNENRPLFASYESRWPDPDDINDVKTNNLETVIRFVNYCKDAVSVTVGGKDGYTLSDFTHITEDQALQLSELKDTPSRAVEVEGLENLTKWNGLLYMGVPATSYKDKTTDFYQKDSDGNVIYDPVTQKPVLSDTSEWISTVSKKVYYFQDYAAQNVTGSSFSPLYEADDTPANKVAAVLRQLESNRPYVFTESVDESQIEYVEYEYYDGAGDIWYVLDNTYSRTDIKKTVNNTTLKNEIYTGKVLTYDGKRWKNREEGLKLWDENDAWVTVYLTPQGTRYTYVNEMGQVTQYNSGEEVVTEVGSNNWTGSFKGATLFDYFKDKKYEHFDVWKLACYYVYLMRFAAVDQVIKNTMMTTEDGKHYYFINYDNDTTMGVRNDGYLAYDWKIDRNSYDDSIGSYCYAGFGSVLWNLLEQDDDFMDKVQQVATAMVTSNVLTYDIALETFNVKQAATWNERLYNNSELYKYIDIYLDRESNSPYTNIKYLPFLQGSRASHREWWLRHRFDLYDSKWSAGEYKTNDMLLYMSATASPNQPKNIFTIVSGNKYYYTIQTNGRTLGNNFVELEADTQHTFVTTSPLAIGDPMTVLGAYNIKKLDLSENRDQLGAGGITFRWDESKFTSKMTELIFGGEKTVDQQNPCSIGVIVNLNKLSALEVLDIRTCNKLTSDPDISNLGSLRKFLAAGSNISTFLPAKGLMLEEVSLPQTITTIKLDNVSLETFDYTPDIYLKNLEVYNVTGSALEGHKLFDFIINWYLSFKSQGIKISGCTCNIEFSNIELKEAYTSDSNIYAEHPEYGYYSKLSSILEGDTKVISGIDLINKIKNDFGFSIDENNNKKENFVIESGVLKVYGSADNKGLTIEDYNTLKNTTYVNDTKKLWDDTAFSALSPFHFDAEESIFINVTDINGYDAKYISYNEYDNIWNIVSEHTAKIRIIMFPADNNRVMNFTPGYFNKTTNKYMTWPGYNVSTKVYSYNNSTFVNNNDDTATINIARLTVDADYQIAITPSLNGVNSSTQIVRIIAKAVSEPRANDVYFTRQYIDNNGEEQTKTVDYLNGENLQKIDAYDYTVKFNLDSYATYDDKYNVDIVKVESSFNKNVIEQDNDFGTLESYIENDEFKFRYTPKISSNAFTGGNNSINFNIYLFTTLNNSSNSIVKSEFDFTLSKQDITGIELLFKDNNVDKAIDKIDDIFIIEHYIKEYKTPEVRYTYQLNINPDNYNVPIDSITIENTSDDLFSAVNVEYNQQNIITDDIKTFDIVLPIRNRNTIHENAEITITINTPFNTIVEKCNVTVGMYFADEIRLIRYKNSKLNLDDDSSQSNRLTVLKDNSDINYIYEFHIYSLINNELYVWGNQNDSIVDKLYDNQPHYLSDNKISEYTQGLQLLENTDSEEYGNIYEIIEMDIEDIIFDDNISKNIVNTNIFNINVKGENIFTLGGTLKYNINVLGKQKEYTNDLVISRVPAISTNFNINSDSIIPYNGTEVDSTISGSGIYYFDKNLNIYDINGVNSLDDSIKTNIDKYILSMLFVYTDSNNVRHFVSLDPWQLEETGYWWNNSSTFWSTTNNDMIMVFGENIGLDNILRGNSNITTLSDLLENYSKQDIFVNMYKYYKLITWFRFINNNNSGSYNSPDGSNARFRVSPANGISQEEESDIRNCIDNISEENFKKLCTYYHYNKIIVTPDIDATNANEIGKEMLFYHINAYKDYANNIVSIPLTSEDYIQVFEHYDLISHGLNKLQGIVGDNTLKNKYGTDYGTALIKNINSSFDFTEKTDENGDLNVIYEDIRNNENVLSELYGSNKSTNDFVYSRRFWSLNLEEDLKPRGSHHTNANKGFVQVFNTNNSSKLLVLKNIGILSGTNNIVSTRMTCIYKVNCLFGAYPLTN